MKTDRLNSADRMPTTTRWLLGTIALTLLAGCQSFSNPFAGPPPQYKTSYGLTPRQKIQRLEQLAVELPRKSPQEQQQLTKELTATLAKEQDPLLRRSLVHAIGALTDPDSNPMLLAATNDPSPHVRVAACEAWARRSGEAATSALSSLLANDADTDVRLAAARALGQIRSPQAIQLLRSALDSNDPALQMTAMQSLRTLTGQGLGDNVNDWHKYLASRQQQVGRPSDSEHRVVEASALMPAVPAATQFQR
jgi:HEAT repeat protein